MAEKYKESFPISGIILPDIYAGPIFTIPRIYDSIPTGTYDDIVSHNTIIPTQSPLFVYNYDRNTDTLERKLIDYNDTFENETDFGLDQAWRIIVRQGDEYDRIAEWNPDLVPAVAESYQEPGSSVLTEGSTVGLDPFSVMASSPVEYDTEYDTLLEYQQVQKDERSED